MIEVVKKRWDGDGRENGRVEGLKGKIRMRRDGMGY